MDFRKLTTVALLLVAFVETGYTQQRKTINIKAESPLRFDPPRFEVAPGTKIKIRLGNLDSTDQPHNIVFTYPGKREALVQAGMMLAEKGPELEYIPQDDSLVLAASELVKTGGKGEVDFTVPNETGIYPYACTFPGHGLVMYGAMYVGITMPEDAMKDPNVPKNALNQAQPITKRPYVQRMFVPDSGPASIAVALPGGTNYVWDAGACTLRYVWTGDFIDTSRHFKGNGSARAKILGEDPYWQGAAKSPFGNEVKFLGYSLNAEKIPTFRYRVDGREIHETITEGVDGGFVRSYKTTGEQLKGDEELLQGEGRGKLSVVSTGDMGITAIFVPAAK